MKGFALRDSTGHYLVDGERVPSITTIRDHVMGKGGTATAATWVAQEAVDLYSRCITGETRRVQKYVATDTGPRLESKEEDPARLLLNPKWLKGAAYRELDAASQRGTVVHDYLHHWHLALTGQAEHVWEPDLEHWTRNRIHDGDGEKPFGVDPMVVLPFVQSLHRWLAKHQIQTVMSEFAIHGTTPSGDYAGTADSLLIYDGELLLVDLKTRANSNRGDILQLAAQRGAQRVYTGEWVPYATPERCASLLVTPGKVTLRILDVNRTNDAWDAWCHLHALYSWLRTPVGLTTQK